MDVRCPPCGDRAGSGRAASEHRARRRRTARRTAHSRKGLLDVACIASPDTILRRYRELVAKKYDGSTKRGPGRPRKPSEMVRLLIKMATENSDWGYTRLRGALRNLGHEIGRSTVKRILMEQGIEPARVRGRKTSWATFIKAHLGVITAADFFTVEVLSMAGLIRYHVFFVIDIATRKVEIAGIKPNPNGSWMKQIARNLLDVDSGFLLGKRHLVLDRDPLYTAEFRTPLKHAGVKVIRLPPRSPDLNAFAERFVLTIKSECLERVVPLGERHLRRVISEFVEHYDRERNHQGLENLLIDGAPQPANTNGPVLRKERLGGLLNYYHRKAA